ncbi:hypothetical protein [Paenibacillus sp. cl141a]|uniref:hypothetical protein n=1 Tax=Paenibacillus sp. cl141a TaxID=1761877 RepID=UPI001C315A86|nr:hypothetical protein [Paenibacillus sp. cl141a]
MIKHRAAKNDSSGSAIGFGYQLRVLVKLASGQAMHFAPAGEFINPFMKPLAAFAKGQAGAMVRTCDKSVQ